MTYTDHNGRGIELRLNWKSPVNRSRWFVKRVVSCKAADYASGSTIGTDEAEQSRLIETISSRLRGVLTEVAAT